MFQPCIGANRTFRAGLLSRQVRRSERDEHFLVVPIFEERPDGPVGYRFNEFRERFMAICAEHRTAGRALAFAFLLFDIDTPELIKVLRDPDYWRALDRVSGSYLSVFTLVGHQPRSDHQTERRNLTGIGPVSDPGARLQLILNSYFGLQTTVDLPALVLFQVEEGRVSGASFIQLQAGSVEATFNEIRELLRDVVDALATSGQKGHSDAGAAFEAIRARLRKRKVVRYLKVGAKTIWELKDIASLVGGVT